jgi:hypothetical protein
LIFGARVFWENCGKIWVSGENFLCLVAGKIWVSGEKFGCLGSDLNSVCSMNSNTGTVAFEKIQFDSKTGKNKFERNWFLGFLWVLIYGFNGC